LKDENGDFIDPRIDITKNNAINIKNGHIQLDIRSPKDIITNE
jgi:hypothetical protein